MKYTLDMHSNRDERCFPRQLIELPLHYKFYEQGRIFRALETVINNISAMGLSAHSDRYLEKGQHIVMTLFIPSNEEEMDYIDTEFQPVFVLAKITWCTKEDDEFKFGAEIVCVEEEHKLRFKRFLESTGLYKRLH